MSTPWAIAFAVHWPSWASQSGLSAPALLAAFRAGDPAQDPPDTSPRWVVGLALSAMADPSLADDLLELAGDPRWGHARGMIVQELGATRDPRAAGLLVRLLADETVSTDAVIGLGKIADPATAPRSSPS